jgi:hypothetical protein
MGATCEWAEAGAYARADAGRLAGASAFDPTIGAGEPIAVEPITSTSTSTSATKATTDATVINLTINPLAADLK